MPTLDPESAHVAPRPVKVSAAAVARAAGVSTATVSYVFNGQSGVSAETREHVQAVAGRLGFTPRKPSHENQRTNIIGLILSNIANPFYPELSVGFSEAAQARGYQVFLSHTEDDQESLTQAIGAMLDRSVDGVAVSVARSDNALSVRQLRSARVPFVQISRTFPHVEADFVGIDDRGAAREMMRHALGHQRWPLATIIGPRASSASAAREEGFVAEARNSGVVIPGMYRISVDITLQGGISAAKHLFGLPDPPRFILCGSDILAIGVMTYALHNGLRIPEDVAISGFDGISLADTPMVDLTGIIQPRKLMSKNTVNLLADRIEGIRHPTTRLCVPHSLRIGRTCGCTPLGEKQ